MQLTMGAIHRPKGLFNMKRRSRAAPMVVAVTAKPQQVPCDDNVLTKSDPHRVLQARSCAAE